MFRRMIGTAFGLLLLVCGPAALAAETYVNPDWEITLTDYGYSDLLFFNNGPLPQGTIHEMLSGEWAAAVGYDGIPLILPEVTMWLEPAFLYPDWTSNSTFVVLTPITVPADTDADGLPEGFSEISNGTLNIHIEYDMEDTVTGTPMGLTGAAFVPSNRFVLKQKYIITNTSGADVTGLRFYQFLHGHPANNETPTVDEVYDAMYYPFGAGTYDLFHYDVTQFSVGTGHPGGFPTGCFFEDHIGFGGDVAPSDWGLGHYRGHTPGRPPGGYQENVERDILLNEVAFGPDEVAGAERWDVPLLADGASVSFEVVLSIRSVELNAGPDMSCMTIDDSGTFVEIKLVKGPCPPPLVAGPFDIIRGQVAELNPGDLGPTQCLADEHMGDNFTLADSVSPCGATFFLVRRGAGVEADYGTVTRLPRSGDCTFP